jgi:hypothetical protein
MIGPIAENGEVGVVEQVWNVVETFGDGPPQMMRRWSRASITMLWVTAGDKEMKVALMAVPLMALYAPTVLFP